MMIGKQIQRIISGFMCLVLTLSVFISPAHAWDSPEQKEEWIQKVEDAGGYYNGAGGVYLP